MASDEDDDLEALRQAALATLKKKPAVVEEAQPIPQLTSSGHSLQGSNSSPWADDFVPDSVPFHDNPPVSQYQDGVWGQQFQQPPYGQGSPTHYSVNNNWLGGRGNYHKPFQRGRGAFPPHNPRLPFGAAQPPRLPFNQTPNAFGPGSQPPPRGSNLIVISTVPEDGGDTAGPNFQGIRFPSNFRGHGAQQGGPGGAGRGAQNGPGPMPVESSSKPVLLRPQDKYCPAAEPSSDSQDASPQHRRKKDKFSRFESSGSESDDESSEEEDNGKETANSTTVSFHNDSVLKEDDKEMDVDDKTDQALPNNELSISAVNSSHVDSDLDEPVLNANLGKSEEKTSDAEVSQEIEDRLLASSPPAQDSEQSPCADESVDSKSVSGAANIEKSPPPSPRPPAVSKVAAEGGTGSSSDSDNESGDESDSEESSSSSSSSDASSDGDSDSDSDAEKSEGNSASEKDSERSLSPSPSQKSEQSDNERSHHGSDSESDSGDKRTAVHRLPAERSSGAVNAKSNSLNLSQTDVKPTHTLTPEERAKLEARKRKFESRQEVKVTGQRKTISLKGILPKSKKPKQPSKTVPIKTITTAKPKISAASKSSATKTATVSRRTNSRRRVSIEEPADVKSKGDSETKNVRTVDDDEEEEESGRSWKRESNRNVKQRTTLPADQPLPGSGSFYSNSQRGFSKNGGYRRGYEPHRGRHSQWQSWPRDTRPEVHYSSSEESEDGRKLISVVVPRSSVGQHSQSKVVSGVGSGEPVHSFGHGRKRNVPVDTSVMDDDDGGRDSGVSSKTKRLQESSGTTGPISVVVSSSKTSKRPRSASSRLSVHQRLGMRKGPEAVRSQSRVNIQPVSHAQTDSDMGTKRQ